MDEQENVADNSVLQPVPDVTESKKQKAAAQLLESQLQQLMLQLTVAQQRLEHAEAAKEHQRDSYESRLGAATAEMENLQQTSSNLRYEKNAVQQQLSKEREESHRHLDAMQDEISQLHAQIEYTERGQVDVKQMEEQLSFITAKLQATEQDLARTEAQLADAAVQKVTALVQLSEMQSRIHSRTCAKANERDLKRGDSGKRSQLRQQVTELEFQQIAALSEKAALQHALEHAHAAVVDLTDSKDAFQAQVLELENRNSGLEEEVRVLTDLGNTWRESVSQLEGMLELRRQMQEGMVQEPKAADGDECMKQAFAEIELLRDQTAMQTIRYDELRSSLEAELDHRANEYEELMERQLELTEELDEMDEHSSMQEERLKLAQAAAQAAQTNLDNILQRTSALSETHTETLHKLDAVKAERNDLLRKCRTLDEELERANDQAQSLLTQLAEGEGKLREAEDTHERALGTMQDRLEQERAAGLEEGMHARVAAAEKERDELLEKVRQLQMQQSSSEATVEEAVRQLELVKEEVEALQSKGQPTNTTDTAQLAAERDGLQKEVNELQVVQEALLKEMADVKAALEKSCVGGVDVSATGQACEIEASEQAIRQSLSSVNGEVATGRGDCVGTCGGVDVANEEGRQDEGLRSQLQGLQEQNAMLQEQVGRLSMTASTEEVSTADERAKETKKSDEKIQKLKQKVAKWRDAFEEQGRQLVETRMLYENDTATLRLQASQARSTLAVVKKELPAQLPSSLRRSAVHPIPQCPMVRLCHAILSRLASPSAPVSLAGSEATGTCLSPPFRPLGLTRGLPRRRRQALATQPSLTNTHRWECQTDCDEYTTGAKSITFVITLQEEDSCEAPVSLIEYAERASQRLSIASSCGSNRRQSTNQRDSIGRSRRQASKIPSKGLVTAVSEASDSIRAHCGVP